MSGNTEGREGRVRDAAWNALAWFELFDLGEAEPEDARVAMADLRSALEEGGISAACPGCGRDAGDYYDEVNKVFLCEHPFHRFFGGSDV